MVSNLRHHSFIFQGCYYVVDQELLESQELFETILHLLTSGVKQRRCDYMNNLLGLIKVLIEKGMMVCLPTVQFLVPFELVQKVMVPH
jgi:hypothetical protein